MSWNQFYGFPAISTPLMNLMNETHQSVKQLSYETNYLANYLEGEVEEVSCAVNPFEDSNGDQAKKKKDTDNKPVTGCSNPFSGEFLM